MNANATLRVDANGGLRRDRCGDDAGGGYGDGQTRMDRPGMVVPYILYLRRDLVWEMRPYHALQVAAGFLVWVQLMEE